MDRRDVPLRVALGVIDWTAVRWFRPAEFQCRCGRPACDAPREPDPTLVTLLDALRDAVGSPLAVTSGLRCAWANAQLPDAAPTSGHLDGTEVDLACATPRLRYRLLAAALARGVPRIGVYPRHVHLGVSPRLPHAVCWVG